MNSGQIFVALDIGSMKVCTLVAEWRGHNRFRILGLGIEPSVGVKKGTIVDVAAAAEAVRTARLQAERTSGFEIGRAFIGIGGKHIQTIASRGVTSLNATSGVIGEVERARALQVAKAIEPPPNHQIVDVIPRSYTVDGKTGVINPIGLHAYRLEVEANIITAARSAMRNLEACVREARITVDRFVVNPVASAMAVLTPAEKKSGALLVDIGSGTTDLAIYINDALWHLSALEVGGEHITKDIATVLYLPEEEAERIKIAYGNASPGLVPLDQIITIQTFGEVQPTQIQAYDLANIIEARVEELFTLILKEVKRSGYDGLLSAGVVLTGGTAALPGIRETATRVMNLPVRVAIPENITGLADRLRKPDFATSVGLLHAASPDDPEEGPDTPPPARRRPDSDSGSGSGSGSGGSSSGSGGEGPHIGKALTDFLGRLLPDD